MWFQLDLSNLVLTCLKQNSAMRDQPLAFSGQIRNLQFSTSQRNPVLLDVISRRVNQAFNQLRNLFDAQWMVQAKLNGLVVVLETAHSHYHRPARYATID